MIVTYQLVYILFSATDITLFENDECSVNFLSSVNVTGVSVTFWNMILFYRFKPVVKEMWRATLSMTFYWEIPYTATVTHLCYIRVSKHFIENGQLPTQHQWVNNKVLLPGWYLYEAGQPKVRSESMMLQVRQAINRSVPTIASILICIMCKNVCWSL